MDRAQVSADGRITIPPSIQKRLNIKAGDRLLFFESDGKICIDNPGCAETALRQMQDALKGRAAEAGITSEEDVQRLVNEVRYGK